MSASGRIRKPHITASAMGVAWSCSLSLHVIKRSDHVRLIAMTIATNFGFDRSVSNVCMTCFFWLRQPRRVHRWDVFVAHQSLPLSHRASTIVTMFCLPHRRKPRTSCSMFKMLQQYTSGHRDPEIWVLSVFRWFITMRAGWLTYSSASAVQACCDSPSLSSAKSSKVPCRPLCASLRSS